MRAMNRPTAVAIRASATPPVTPRGSTSPSAPNSLKARTMPVIVPSRPRRGAAVTVVSRIHPPDRPLPILDDDPEESPEVVPGPQRLDFALELSPVEAVGLGHGQQG